MLNLANPALRSVLALSLIAVLALIASCSGADSPPEPAQAPALSPVSPAGAQLTRTPWPTVWPTDTPRPATPYPTPDLTSRTEEPLDNFIMPGAWLNAPFTDIDGAQRTLADYAGRLVIVHTLAAGCDLCIDQQRMLAQAIQDRYDINVLPDAVYLALGVEPGETPALIESVVRERLGEQWATIELVYQDDVAGDYITGLASDALRRELERAFGSGAVDPLAQTVIVVEPDGLAHLTTEGLVDWRELRDVITAYGFPPESPSP